MIQRIMLVSNILKMVMLISGSISLLHLSVINDTNLMAFPQNDKVLIGGTYYSSSSSNKNASAHAIILLHMLGHDRNDWNLFASTLLHMLGHDRNDWNLFASTLSNNSIGYAVLSIDLRGHGESLDQNGKAISFQSFTPNDFNKMVLDVKAAKQFLVTQKGINPNEIAIVGASIGANVALNYAASDPSIRAVVLLSPGLNYKGVITSDSIRKYVNPIYMATGGKDRIAGNDPQTLCNEINCGNKLKVYQDSSSHGTDLFLDKSLNPPLDKLVLLWLDATFGKSV